MKKREKSDNINSEMIESTEQCCYGVVDCVVLLTIVASGCIHGSYCNGQT